MRVAIDGAGRIVVPKPLRRALCIQPGQQLEATVRDGHLEIEVSPTPMRLAGNGPSVVAIPLEPLPPLTTDQVRETIEQIRR